MVDKTLSSIDTLIVQKVSGTGGGGCDSGRQARAGTVGPEGAVASARQLTPFRCLRHTCPDGDLLGAERGLRRLAAEDAREVVSDQIGDP